MSLLAPQRRGTHELAYALALAATLATLQAAPVRLQLRRAPITQTARVNLWGLRPVQLLDRPELQRSSETLMTAYLGEFEQLVLLALLRLGPDAGTPAVRDAVAAGSRRTVWLGAVFTTLERLEQKGLVRSSHVAAGRGGKRRKIYAIEPAGEAAIARAYETWARMTRGLEPKLEGR